jgi:hypothetical protein
VADARGQEPLARGGADIGKIVRSDSHVRYTCQIYAPGETTAPPNPEDYAFGSFVRIPLRSGPAAPDTFSAPGDVRLSGHGADSWAVGLIYDTTLMNPAFGVMGPRLSNDEQVELFSPDYVVERAALVSVLLLGVVERGADGRARVSHGVPALAPDLGAPVCPLGDEAVRRFHEFADASADVAGMDDREGASARPYLHMGYLPHAVQQDNALLPMAILRVIERLETLFPERRALLSIVRRNFAWRLKVQSAG